MDEKPEENSQVIEFLISTFAQNTENYDRPLDRCQRVLFVIFAHSNVQVFMRMYVLYSVTLALYVYVGNLELISRLM